MSARMSGDNQKLRELGHQILARRTVRNPPPNFVPGRDVQPLREHDWLDSLADVGVVADYCSGPKNTVICKTWRACIL